MNWLKSLWSKLVNKTSVSPTLVVVEEEPLEVSYNQVAPELEPIILEQVVIVPTSSLILSVLVADVQAITFAVVAP